MDGRIPDLAVVRADVLPTLANRNPYGPEHFALVGEVVSLRTCKTDRFAQPGEYAEVDDAPPIPWGVFEPTLAELGIS